MTATVRVEIGLDTATLAFGEKVLAALRQFMELSMVDILSQIEKEVGNNTSIESSIEQLVANFALAAQNAAPNNPRLQAVLDTMTANDARLAALVVANTPVASPNPVIPAAVVP
jgi:hypothetical protein